VLVKKGDQVQTNQVLTEIDPSSNVTLTNAEPSLLSAEQALTNLQNVAVAQTQAQVNLVNAQIAVTNAQNHLDALNNPPSQAAQGLQVGVERGTRSSRIQPISREKRSSPPQLPCSTSWSDHAWHQPRRQNCSPLTRW
jgi:hypothetical protein